jgi:hypothetical protein
LGHSLPTELDRVRTPAGTVPILSVDDVPQLRCGAQPPVAVLIACYSGAVDSSPDCLAEELLNAEEGPIAVIAATRVSMPYGNTVLGCELLRACFVDRAATIGEMFQLAQRCTVESAAAGTLRASLDMLAQGISPPPVELELERREHAQMYQLFGDPLTRLPPGRADAEIARSSGATSVR